MKEYGTSGIFSFLVILGTVHGYNWSVRACGCFEVGHLMNLFELLFAFSSLVLVAVGSFTLIRFPLPKPVL